MNVLALFDGHSGGRIALDVIGIKPNKYYASEIDKHAIKASAACYDDITQMGSVTEWRTWNINWSTIDLLIGGSPCQGFSMVGKQAGTTAVLNGEKVIVDSREKYLELKAAGAEFLSQSYLFWEYILCLDHVKKHNPKVKFFLENVKMKKEFLGLITSAIGCEPVFINSALVSAQNRQRWYWCNWGVEQPEDRKIYLRDILEHGVDMSFVSPTPKNHKGGNQINPNYKSQANTIHDPSGKMPTICAGTHGYALGHVPVNYDTPHRVATAADIKGHDYNKRIYSVNGKSPTLAAATGGNLEPKVLCGAMRGRYIVNGKRADHKVNTMAGKTEQRIELRRDNKTNCLTTVKKDNYVVMAYNRKTGLGRELEKAYPLNASDWRGLNRNQTQNSVVDTETYLYRKLTPRECGRLQTVPEHIIDKMLQSGVSNTQLYKMFGNGWTIEVIAHIFNQMELPVQVFARQLELFGDAA